MSGLDLGGLLTIDVASELRKLCQAQLEGSWQLPAELVRRAIRAGAARVSVSFAGNQVVVTDDGPALDPALLGWTALLVDRQQDNQERHRALTTLEAAGELALLTLAGVDSLRALDIVSTDPGREHHLRFREGTRPTALAGPARGPVGTRITLRLPGLERRRASQWLTDVARFAPVPVLVDGRPVADGWGEVLAQLPLRPPLRGRIGLPLEGESGHAFLLAHGLVSAHLTIPEAPGFEAAIELGPESPELTPARLREAATSRLPALIDQAVDALIATARQGGRRWGESHRARLARLALQATTRCPRRAPELAGLPLFRAVTSSGPTLLDLTTLTRVAAADPARTLLALLPQQRPQSYAIGPEPVLLADDAERSLLAEALQVRFRTPLRRESFHSLGATTRRALHLLRGWLGDWGDRLRHPLRRPVLTDEALAPTERALLQALRAQLRAHPGNGLGDAALCEGQGPLRRDRAARLILPRENPTVRACVRAFTSDQEWLRLIHLALVNAGRRR